MKLPRSGFRRLASEGRHRAVLCEVVDRGERPNKFEQGKLQHEIAFVFQVEERTGGEFDRPKEVWKICKLSSDARSNCYKVLTALGGKPPVPGDEIDDHLGTTAILQVTDRGEGVNVEVLAPAEDFELAPEDYTPPRGAQRRPGGHGGACTRPPQPRCE